MGVSPLIMDENVSTYNFFTKLLKILKKSGFWGGNFICL
jgi:hypothetical protein